MTAIHTKGPEKITEDFLRSFMLALTLPTSRVQEQVPLLI